MKHLSWQLGAAGLHTMMFPRSKHPGLAVQGNATLLWLLAVLSLLAILPYPVPSDLHVSSDGSPRSVPAPPELAALQAELARLTQLGHSAMQFRSAYSSQTWLGMPSHLQQGAGGPDPVAAFAQRVGAQFAHSSAHGLLPCAWDPSLPLLTHRFSAEAAAPATPPAHNTRAAAVSASRPAQPATSAGTATSSAGRYFLASNQYNSAHAMPNFVLQLLSLALVLPQGHLYVSIYESGSTDSTPEWLEFLSLLLKSIDVPATIIVRGSLTRQPGQDRLAFLASVRNAALRPLEDLAAAAPAAASTRAGRVQTAAATTARPSDNISSSSKGDSSSRSSSSGGSSSSDSSSSSSRSSSSSSSSSGRSSSFVPDYIVFVNDVFFCAGDVLRLMQHGADVTCGLDTSRTLGGSHWASRLLPLPVEFYDFWVARDVDGRRLRRYAPYVVAPESVARMRSGLPFRVYCCWNGLVVLRAAPFLSGLRFRQREASAGECDASECSLLCDDFHRLGYGDAVIDPGIRVSYSWSVAKALAAGWVEQSRLLPWSKVASALPYHSSSLQQQPAAAHSSRLVQCCPKIPGGEHAEFSKCAMVDVLAVNHTRSVLRAHA